VENGPNPSKFKDITQKPNISITVAYGVSIRINLCGIWTPFPLEEYIPKTLEPAYLTVTAGRFDRYLLWEMATFFIRKPYASSTRPNKKSECREKLVQQTLNSIGISVSFLTPLKGT